jgi:predicted amidohydrolase
VIAWFNMREVRVGSAQFEPQDGGKEENLERMARLARQAAVEGAELIVFHECCISGYTFLEGLARAELAAQAETVPGGPSIERVVAIARETGVSIGAGLIESEGSELFNCYFIAGPDGFVAKHRKIHAFINENLSCGDRYTVFEHRDAKIGILTCYDNNLPENVRITAMMGAEIILMPHVTGCLPSPMPGRGTVNPAVWENRERDPVRCRQEFDGPKGRGWLMRWLPARAFENGVYAVYSNPIGLEGGTIKPGGSMILDPFGEILAECRRLGEDVVVAALDPEKLSQASGRGYIRARRPDLYAKLLEPNPHLGPGGRPEVWWKKHKGAQPSG